MNRSIFPHGVVLSPTQRNLTVLAGAGLFAYGITRHSSGGLILAGLGGLLIGAALKAQTGRGGMMPSSQTKKLREANDYADLREQTDYPTVETTAEYDEVDQASLESFPASDPPSFNPSYT